jgi:hypothetical protein
MMATIPNSEYQEKISTAEAAVAGMADPQLKQVAFGKILEKLLEDAAVDGSEKRTVRSPVRREAKPAAKVVSRTGPIAYIEELISEQFFKIPKTMGEVRIELANRGHHIPRTSMSGPLQMLCQRKTLRRMKHSVNGKEMFAYSNW